MSFSMVNSFAAITRESKRAGGCMALGTVERCSTYNILTSFAKTVPELLNKWVFSYQELLSVPNTNQGIIKQWVLWDAQQSCN